MDEPVPAALPELRLSAGDFGLGRHGCDDGLPSRGVALALGVHSAVAGGARDSGRHFLDTQIREEQYEGTAAGGKDTMKAKIHVTLKQGILDPQGKAIEHVLDSLGFTHAANVRVGKYMEVDLNEPDRAKADAQVKQMCEQLLANTVIEDYRYELQ